jgi:hypothetical protein
MLELPGAARAVCGIALLIVWAAAALSAARVAHRKENRWLGFFILRLFFLPVGVDLCRRGRSPELYSRDDRRAAGTLRFDAG